MRDTITLYHGSHTEIHVPDLSMSRRDIDFGSGFYLTEDLIMASKWACYRETAICNKYELSLDKLKVYEFSLGKEWLDFVVANRKCEKPVKRYEEYDVLVGMIADDRLFSTIDLYGDGLISADTAIEVLSCMNYGSQYVLKSQKAVQSLKYTGHILIQGEEKEKYMKMYQEDRVKANQQTTKILRRNSRGIQR